MRWESEWYEDIMRGGQLIDRQRLLPPSPADPCHLHGRAFMTFTTVLHYCKTILKTFRSKEGVRSFAGPA